MVLPCIPCAAAAAPVVGPPIAAFLGVGTVGALAVKKSLKKKKTKKKKNKKKKISQKGGSIKKDESKILNAKGKIQKLQLFNLGNAMSGAPTIIGNIQLARPVKAGIIAPNTIIKPCTVVI